MNIWNRESDWWSSNWCFHFFKLWWNK